MEVYSPVVPVQQSHDVAIVLVEELQVKAHQDVLEDVEGHVQQDMVGDWLLVVMHVGEDTVKEITRWGIQIIQY